MNCIIGGRRWGKTTKLLKLVLNDPIGMMVVHNRTRREQIVQQIMHDFNQTRVQAEQKVAYFAEMTHGMRVRRGTFNLYVDDLDLILETMLAHQVKCFTATAGLYDWRDEREHIAKYIDDVKKSNVMTDAEIDLFCFGRWDR